MESKKSEAVDPDVWTVLSLLISAVSMFAQLASLKSSSPSRGLGFDSTNVAYEKMRDEVEAAIRSAEKLVRLLSNATGSPSNPLDALFLFGQSQTFFSGAQSQQYGEIIQKIAMNAANISIWTLNIIQGDPGFAAEIGNRIMVDIQNINSKINSLFQGRLTNQQVLDECLFMLRTFNQILGGLERGRN